MMMEAARTSETSVDNYFTRQYILEDNSELQSELSVYCLHHLENITVSKESKHVIKYLPHFV
jgi:hypothetical protein